MTTYTIHTKSNGTYTAQFNSAGPNNWTRGDTVSFEFWFDDEFDQALESYADFAGKFTISTMINGVEKYRTNIPTNINIDSLLWGIEPSQSLKDRNVVGVWGLIDSINNQRPSTLNEYTYQIDVYVLAPFEDYADVSAVEGDLLL